MALHFTDASGKARITPLSASGTYTIGRHTTVDIPIEWDARASRVHARLQHRDGEWTITDCGSTNGTFVRSQFVTGTATVRPGDVFIVGSTAFTLRSPGDERGLAWSRSEVTIIEPSGSDG
jgi:pSer/pThr/pTyr-binding forkhead associated (FHA) protein